jgi:hypothetical protein
LGFFDNLRYEYLKASRYLCRVICG